MTKFEKTLTALIVIGAITTLLNLVASFIVVGGNMKAVIPSPYQEIAFGAWALTIIPAIILITKTLIKTLND